MHKRANPFLSTRLMTSSREDHLTEFFAGAIEIDRPFRKRYVDLVLGPHAERNGWPNPSIRTVKTQVSFVGTGCCPDMVLELEDGHLVACEHKIEAPETLSSVEQAPQEPLPQLERYLNLPIHGLVYVRATWKPPADAVLQHPLYVRPAKLEHFLWRDFYPLLTAGDNPYTRWIAEGFQHLGYTPPHPPIGDLTLRENRENLAKLWASTATAGRSLGWKVERGSVCELYFVKNPAAKADMIWICPGTQLLIRATPRSPETRAEIEQGFRRVAQASPILVTMDPCTVPRAGGPQLVIDAFASLNELVGEIENTSTIEMRLRDFVEPFLRMAT